MTLFTKALTLVFGPIALISAWQPEHECPKSINVRIPNNQEYISEREASGMIWDEHENVGSGIATMEDVHTLLLYCPDITSLDVYPSNWGCVAHPDRWNIPWSLDGSDKGRIPALESITLNRYDFDQREWYKIAPPQEFVAPAEEDTGESWLAPWKVWFHSGNAERWFDVRNLPKEQSEKSNLELWLDQMDWTRLKSLTIIDERGTPKGEAFYERLPNSVPALESLMVKGPWWETVSGTGESFEDTAQGTQKIRRARDFIMAFPENSLKSLSWLESELQNASEILDILKYHGQELTSFEWREAEGEDDRRPVFSPTQLREIATLAPSLKSLTIDLNRNGTWPVEELTAIAESFPKLTNLTVYFELASDCYRGQTSGDRQTMCDKGCFGWDQFERPLLNEHEAAGVFKMLREKKIGDELTSAVFRAGLWDPVELEMTDFWFPFFHITKPFMDCTVLNSNGSRKSEAADVCQGDPTELNAWAKQTLEQCDEKRKDRERDEL